MRRLSCLCASALFLLTAAGCIVEADSNRSASGKPEIQVERKAPDRDISPDEEGAFERLGARMDRGAEKLDKGLEKGAGKLGEAMEKAGERMQERSTEAQRRRAEQEASEAVGGTSEPEVEVHTDLP